jgi:Mrp family chromosome partitioning ATPase
LVKSKDLQKSLSALEMVKADVLGIVLNRLPAKDPDAYTYGYYAQEQPSKGTRKSRSRSALHADGDFDNVIFGEPEKTAR